MTTGKPKRALPGTDGPLTKPEPAEANAVRPNDILTLGDDMPVEVRIRLKCAEIAVKATGHDSYAGILNLAVQLEDFVVNGKQVRHS